MIFVLSFAMVCTLLAGVNVVAFAAEDLDDTISVQKFYYDVEKGGNGEHIYTIDEGEISWYKSLPSWNDEGEAWKAPVSSNSPVYRVCNYNTGEHLWIADKGYVDYLVGEGWTQEQGIAFYSDDNKGVPVYRLWDGTGRVGSHHYSTDAGEISWLESLGWKNEGPQFYGVKGEEPTTKAMSATQTGANEITVAATEGEFTGLELFSVSHGDLVDELADLDYDEELDVYTITLADPIVDAVYTVSCSDTDFAAVTFEGQEVEPGEIESVVATGAKELTVTFSSDVTYDEDDFVVTKDFAKPSIADVTVEGNVAVITLGSKMTKGTYTVTVGESSESVDVEDEKLAAYTLVGENLIEVAPATDNNTAGIPFVALNQYMEKIACDNPTITSSFGTALVQQAPSASNDYMGKIAVTGIKDVLAVPGTKGTMVLVDNTTGVSLTSDVVYSASSTISSVEVEGFYNIDDEEMDVIKAGEDASDYYLLVSLTDQYGFPVNATTAAGSADVTITTSPGITGITTANSFAGAKAVEVDGVEYVGIPLVGENVKAGDFYMTFVNNKKGLLAQETFTVVDSVVVSSINVAPTATLFAGDKIELDVEATTTDGDVITTFDEYQAAQINITSSVPADAGAIVTEKQLDGTFKVYYTPSANGLVGKNSDTRIFTITANDNASANYIVKTTSVKVYAPRVATTVVGLDDMQPVAVALGQDWTLAKKYIEVEDQYGNLMSSEEVVAADIHVSAPAVTDVSQALADTDTFANGIEKVQPAANQVTGEFVVYFNVGAEATAQSADFSVKVQVGDPEKATNLAIAQINTAKNGAIVQVAADATDSGIDADDIMVVGKINGKLTVIPAAQYVIMDDTFTSFTDPSTGDVEYGVRTATLTVGVDTDDGLEVITGDYVYSDLPSVVSDIEAVKYDSTADATQQTTSGKLRGVDFAEAFKFTDQYGNEIADPEGVRYAVQIVSGKGADGLFNGKGDISHNGTEDVNITTVTAAKEGVVAIVAYYGTLQVQSMLKYVGKA